jgi:hypothetical protein
MIGPRAGLDAVAKKRMPALLVIAAGVYLASYLVGTRELFVRGKAMEAWN